MESKRKTIREVIAALKEIRKRPPTKEQLEKYNRIIEKDDAIEIEQEKQKERVRKIARKPESSL